MSLEYTRQCDMCKEFKSCEMTYFTERMWFCEACSQPAVPADDGVNWQGLAKMIDCPPENVQNIKLPPNTAICTKFGDIILLATKDELIDISRTIGLALSIGQAETPLGERKIIVKVIK